MAGPCCFRGVPVCYLLALQHHLLARSGRVPLPLDKSCSIAGLGPELSHLWVFKLGVVVHLR